jgi:hypothetical protein
MRIGALVVFAVLYLIYPLPSLSQTIVEQPDITIIEERDIIIYPSNNVEEQIDDKTVSSNPSPSSDLVIALVPQEPFPTNDLDYSALLASVLVMILVASLGLRVL